MDIKADSKDRVEALERELGETLLALERAKAMALDWEKTFDSSNDAIWILDRDQRIIRSNKKAESLFSHPRESFSGKRCWEIVHGTSGPIPECPILRAKKTLKREGMELDLGERHYLVTVDPMADSEGGFAGAVHTISDRTDLDRMIRELKRSEEDFHQLFEAESDAIFLIDNKSGRILRTNGAASEMYGYTQEELLSMKNSGLSAEPEETRRVTTETPVVAERVVKIPLRWHRRKSGERFAVEITGRFFEREGMPVHIAAIREITERLKAEEERERLREQLFHAQKLESVGRLAGGVAHDFNNMLGVIIGNAEVLLERLEPRSDEAREVREILNAAERSADLTSQLLAFARRQTAIPKLLDLNETISSMLKMLRRLIGEDISLVFMPGASLWHVKIDPAQMDQILANLCVNAKDAITGTGRITIETRNVTLDEAYCSSNAEAESGDYVQIAVSDDGCGMDQETLSRLFEPFFTTKEVGKGTGLGLATVYGIVKQNRGFINAYSEKGHGTCFKIFLPKAREIPADTPAPEQVQRLEGTETVLLVEDEESVLNLGKRILERYGYRVIAAENPAKAMEAVKAHKGGIELLITDVVMPEMNGRELKASVEALKPGVKVLYMSGYTADVIAQKGIVEKGSEFLQKPFTVKGLASKVRRVLDS